VTRQNSPSRTIDWRRIGAAHPELQIRSMSFLGAGWTCHSFLVNGSLVFGFPERPEVWPELEREIAFLAGRRLLEPAQAASLFGSYRETLANLSITGHLCGFSDQPGSKIVQCGEPRPEAEQNQQLTAPHILKPRKQLDPKALRLLGPHWTMSATRCARACLNAL
jgi:hypothetical protein